MTRAGLVAAWLLVAAGTRAEDMAAAGWLNVPLSVRQMGMGETTPGGNDVLRTWSNPALLADQPTRGALAMNGGSEFGGAQTVLGAAGGWRVAPAWSLGLIGSASSMSFVETDAFGDPAGGRIARAETAGGVVAARRLGWLRAGVTLKGVSDRVAGDAAGAGALDAGVAAVWERATLGLAIRNIGGRLREGAAGSENLVPELRIGGSWRIEFERVLLAAEYVAAGSAGGAGFGVEWWPAKRFATRAGLARMGVAREAGVTAGFTALFGGAGLDYALATHPLGLTHRVSLSYAYGEPPVRAPAVEAPVVAPAPPGETEAAAPAQPAAGQLNVAVAELSPQNVSPGDAAVIADMLRNELVKSGLFNVVEKQNMDKLLAEQAFQQTGCTSEDCAIKLGKMLNVQRMVVGSFGKLLDKYFITVRVVNVETGKIVYGDDANGSTVEQLQAGVRAVGGRLVKRIR